MEKKIRVTVVTRGYGELETLVTAKEKKSILKGDKKVKKIVAQRALNDLFSDIMDYRVIDDEEE